MSMDELVDLDADTEAVADLTCGQCGKGLGTTYATRAALLAHYHEQHKYIHTSTGCQGEEQPLGAFLACLEGLLAILQQDGRL
jgi:hypothetical protein